MSNLVNIAFQGGSHGNYLRFCIDKFSSITPDFPGLPFNDNNTAHVELNYSGKVNRYHPMMEQPFFQNTTEPHILITIQKEDLLFLDRWVTTRAGDFRVDVSEDMVQTHDKFLSNFPWTDKFKKYYNIDLTKDRVPKFLLRDFYKLSFLDPDKHGMIIIDKVLREHKPANTFEFPVSSFWDKDKFTRTLEKMNKELNLKIDINRCLPTHDIFLNRFNFIDTKDRVMKVIEAIQNKQNMDIQNLDTVEQAYVSAWIEKNYEFVIVPLCNNFFKNTIEVINWLKYYPQHYKAMNPNLPTFNNIPNPFHLWNLKK